MKVAYVPEFLRLSTALETFRQADRFVIGANDPDVAASVAAIYSPLQRPIHVTDIRSAEMGKHASNAWLATSVSFINQVADLCEQVGADVREVATIMKLDPRVGPHAFLGAGLGYAGGTLGREIRALQKLGAANGISTELFDAVDEVNSRRIGHLMTRLRSVQPGIARRANWSIRPDLQGGHQHAEALGVADAHRPTRRCWCSCDRLRSPGAARRRCRSAPIHDAS